jgi:hypothetical protein
VPVSTSNKDDVHYAKEIVHYSDQTTISRLRPVINFKRDFYITKEQHRNHQDKKEFENIDKLYKMTCTQSELRDSVAKSLQRAWSSEDLRRLAASPYLYGTDISSTALLKKSCSDKYPDTITPYSVATFDIETDVVNGTKDILMITVTFKDKCFTAVNKSFLKGIPSPEDKFQNAVREYIPEYVDARNMVPVLHIADGIIDMIKEVFNSIHEWKPDFLAIWNIDYDIPYVLDTLEKHGVNAVDIFCDPSVSDSHKVCKYHQGAKKKTTASGKVTPINPSSQWHYLECTSSYYVIDAMCSYKQIRSAEQEESSYKLDAILNKELGIRKLNFKEVEGLEDLKWHQVMQSKYKIEYIVYNIFDCISMLELDDKTKDLQLTLPAYASSTDFSNFKSQPTRITDSLHSFCLDRGVVLGTVGNKKLAFGEPVPKPILSLKDWILALPAYMNEQSLPLIKEDPKMKTNIRCFVSDIDKVSAYPSVISVGNVSKATTKRELISISGIDESVFRLQNLNLMFSETNSIEYTTNMFSASKPYELLHLV